MAEIQRKVAIISTPNGFCWSGLRSTMPIPSQPSVTTPTIIAVVVQIERILRTGQIHWLSNTAGTIKVSQNACTETSALVGGSQPQLPQNEFKCGIGNCNSCRAPNISATQPHTYANNCNANLRLEHKLLQLNFIACSEGCAGSIYGMEKGKNGCRPFIAALIPLYQGGVAVSTNYLLATAISPVNLMTPATGRTELMAFWRS